MEKNVNHSLMSSQEEWLFFSTKLSKSVSITFLRKENRYICRQKVSIRVNPTRLKYMGYNNAKKLKFNTLVLSIVEGNPLQVVRIALCS